MVVTIIPNPEPNNPKRLGTDIEVRLMFRCATGKEGELIGAAIRRLIHEIRPEVKPETFQYLDDMVVS